MARMIRPLANVHEQLRRLPGIGSKTALRLAYHIIDMPEEEVRRLAETLLEAKRQIRLCDICYNLTDAETCEVCGNAGRDHSVVCVVEQPQDVMAMERSRGYNGVYHVLHGGALAPEDGEGQKAAHHGHGTQHAGQRQLMGCCQGLSRFVHNKKTPSDMG